MNAISHNPLETAALLWLAEWTLQRRNNDIEVKQVSKGKSCDNTRILKDKRRGGEKEARGLLTESCDIA
ncbi:hypothetical protein JOB18_028425 [Solea senegalensis]|uniref:Uncharacterized protein n=1 Tax=Solea senegalensis TaxID=28829 RepID=A0AAV6RJ21_SOLSE|nr:hypothetical protein JOB18_028425 [Solea senegalensis]